MQAASGHAKFEKKVLERTEQLESMAMQAAMDRSKSHSQTSEVLNRLEQMTVQQATNVAKFEKKVETKNDSMESMLMQASMSHAKFERLMDGRTTGMEAMLMSASVGNGKLTSMVRKLLPQEEVELETPDLPTQSQYAGTGIGSADAAATTGKTSGFSCSELLFLQALPSVRTFAWQMLIRPGVNRYRTRRVSQQCASLCMKRLRARLCVR